MLGANDECKGQKYVCSNPNCNRVFSKPKIIKYHVCPTCQTLVNMAAFADQGEIQTALAKQKLLKHRKPKVERDNPKELSETAIKVAGSPAGVEEPTAPEKTPEINEQIIAPRQIQAPKQETFILAPTQQVAAAETKTVSASSSGCQYGFGYLSQREKGESIPETCIECAKSLECMLSEYYKAEKGVKEIRKWYNF